MITLKDYQQRVLDSLRMFFHQCSLDGHPDAAFSAVQSRNGQMSAQYSPISVAGLRGGMPYICLRVPTGGGKTLLACHTAGIAMNQLLHAERAVVLWLVPSNTILDQTADALRDPQHPYRRALELECGSVEVVTIEEALQLSRATVDGQTVVIVATIQSFRAEDTTGRKVYAQNGALLDHFINVPPDRQNDLSPGADGKPIPSLVNVLRLRRPIVIVDEAHNARTDLSFSTLGNVMPSCIVEYTATPALTKNPSNVLHRVSAAELKAADMIKLPLRVITRHPSQRDQLLADAIALRASLENFAILEGQLTSEYIRPIMLIQAERVDDCEGLRDRLVNDFNLARDEIKISVGRLDELKNIDDILSPNCKVRHIITVEKLREGWDCPFAYVLCSLKETRSATAIEQIVGRILRLPHAQPKRHPDLDCAYAFSVSDSLPGVLNELRQALENNGFTSAEAQRIILPVPQGVLPLGAQPRTVKFEPGVEIDPAIAQLQNDWLGGKVKIEPQTGEITVFVPLSDEETDGLQGCVRSPEAKQQIADVVKLVRETEIAFGGSGASRTPSPYERQINFRVPLLSFKEGESLFEFDSTFLIEHAWKLSDKSADLSERYNPLHRPLSRTGALDVDARGRVAVVEDSVAPADDFVVKLHQQTMALGKVDAWTIAQLVAWLDRHIEHRDIPLSESTAFLLKVVRGQMAKHGADINALAIDRFRLRDEIDSLIEQHRKAEREAIYQLFLAPTSQLTVSQERELDYKTISYDPSWTYEGSFKFKKHYFGSKPGELHEFTPNGAQTEEFRCAQFLDNLPEVKHWVRNLSRRNTSFRLLTSTDWFYPDFVCELMDGRLLVVEYKGLYLYDSHDAEEKRIIGAVWASRSNGKGLFVMPTNNDTWEIARTVRAAAHTAT